MPTMLDRIIATPKATQSTIPTTRKWRSDAREVAQQADDDAMMDWYLQNRGVQSPDGGYFGPELSAAPALDYDPSVRQVGQSMRAREAIPVRTRGEAQFMDNLNDLVMGYDPREGRADYFPEEGSALEAGLFGGMFVPGAVGRMSGGLLGLGIAKDIAGGRHVPGLIDAAWLGGMGTGMAKETAWMYWQDRLSRAIRRRAARQAERALKANALPLPDPNRTVIEKGMFGRPRATRRYVDPSMEFTPYEEVR